MKVARRGREGFGALRLMEMVLGERFWETCCVCNMEGILVKGGRGTAIWKRLNSYVYKVKCKTPLIKFTGVLCN